MMQMAITRAENLTSKGGGQNSVSTTEEQSSLHHNPQQVIVLDFQILNSILLQFFIFLLVNMYL